MTQIILLKILKFLEIGFWVGRSASMWDNYFTHPKTKICFIDINPDYYQYTKNLSPRCSLHMVDQENISMLQKFIHEVGREFDIIIDDGGHTMNQQITSFKALFPYVKKGGMYIIEDLHTSYWNNFGSEGNCDNPKASPNSTIRFLQALVDDLNFVGAKSCYANREKYVPLLANLSEYQRDIASIHFYTSICIIFKN